ncbi:hypothetical protein D3C73_1400430 [compost metagenome]
MDYPVKAMFISSGVSSFELVAAMLAAFEFQYFGSHPLRYNFWLYISFKKEFNREVEFSRNEYFLFAVLGINLCFLFHVSLSFWLGRLSLLIRVC